MAVPLFASITVPPKPLERGSYSICAAAALNFACNASGGLVSEKGGIDAFRSMWRTLAAEVRDL